MPEQQGFIERFMRMTGRARAFFGPAQSSSLDHPMTDENQALLKEQQAQAGQWETITRADGSTYIVPRSAS
jgi:hypothetical protein